MLARGFGGEILEGLTAPRPASTSHEARIVGGAFGHAVFNRPSSLWVPAMVPWLHIGESVYRPPVSPRKMATMSAAITLRTRQDSDEEAASRRQQARVYSESIDLEGGVNAISFPTKGEPGYLRYPLLVRSGLADLGGVSATRHLGIERSYPVPLPRLEQAQVLLDRRPGSFPGAEQLVRELVTLPTHQKLDGVDLEKILKLLGNLTGRNPFNGRSTDLGRSVNRG